jgi:hypothetical protein
MNRNAVASIWLYPDGKLCKYLSTFYMVRLYNCIDRSKIIKGENVYVFPEKLIARKKQASYLLR